MRRQGALLIAVLAVTLVILMVGCATILSGSKQDVLVDSDPGQAKVVVMTAGGIEVAAGKTPFGVKLARKNKYLVHVTLEGYEKKEVYIDQGFNPVALVNILCGGIIGIVVDFVSGAVYSLEPDQIMVTLEHVGLHESDDDLMLVMYAYNEEGQLIKYMSPMIRALPEAWNR